MAAFTDMQGRLMGKRVQAEFFLEEMEAGHGLEGCNYLLALEMEMDPVPGYAMASWERGYGDFRWFPDFVDACAASPGSRRPRSCSATSPGRTARPSWPRLARCSRPRWSGLAPLGFEPMFGSELEFYLIRQTYAEAHAQHYRDLTPSVPYILDYHILATSYDEPLHPPAAQRHAGRGHPRSRAPRARPGRASTRSTFASADAMHDGRQPRHLQERRPRRWRSERLLDHLHGQAGPHLDRQLLPHPCQPLARGLPTPSPASGELFDRYLAGWIACAGELAVFLAPNINSYKRYAAGSWAPTTSPGATTTAPAASGSSATAAALRVENADPRRRTPTPTSPSPRSSPRACTGSSSKLEPPPALEGNAYESDAARFPSTLRDAISRARGGSDGPGRLR